MTGLSIVIPPSGRRSPVSWGCPTPSSMPITGSPSTRCLKTTAFWPGTATAYDPLNYEKDRDSSSLGDAIVIDLLTRFPEEVGRDPFLGANQDLIAQLKELDNVRPVLDIPAWIQGVCNGFPGVEDKVHEIWNDLLDKFFKLVFIKEHDRWGPDLVDFLQMALRLTSGLSFKKIQETTRSVGGAPILQESRRLPLLCPQ